MPADATTALLEQLVRIDSQNPRLVTGGGGEQQIASFCVEWLRAQGVEAWLDEVEPGRSNAVARVSGGAAPVLALCAHLDTVAVSGSDGGLEPRVADGRMYGRGTYDMKGAAAAIMVAMADLARHPPPGTVMAALVVDEEFASAGAFDFVRRYPTDACIVTEPSEGSLILAHKGFVWAGITTDGTAAHGSRWQDGVSAIGRMARIAAAIENFDRDVLRRRTHPLLGPASVHCAMISGGTGWSTYASTCTMQVERRTLPGESAADVLQELRAIVAETGETATVHEVLSRSPLECARGSAAADAVRASVAEHTGAVPPDAGVAYWMDAAVFADAGADTVNYGPAGGGAHAAVEWVDLESVALCSRVLATASRRFCAAHRSDAAARLHGARAE